MITHKRSDTKFEDEQHDDIMKIMKNKMVNQGSTERGGSGPKVTLE